MHSPFGAQLWTMAPGGFELSWRTSTMARRFSVPVAVRCIGKSPRTITGGPPARPTCEPSGVSRQVSPFIVYQASGRRGGKPAAHPFCVLLSRDFSRCRSNGAKSRPIPEAEDTDRRTAIVAQSRRLAGTAKRVFGNCGYDQAIEEEYFSVLAVARPDRGARRSRDWLLDEPPLLCSGAVGLSEVARPAATICS